ncbi:MAG: alpha-E domain-containing protein [Chloroflexota bacterium]|nr:alpha-E domain-containing protein [Chloroflexota bacterium]MDE2958939.1 alpha-E domain-containing protein [Chloroflexota bacterium]
MVEPRSITFRPDRWLTDSRVYNLIWMGQWLERADNIARVVNTFARMAVESGSDMLTLQQSLGNAAAIRGISVDDPTRTLELLLKQHQVSSIHHSLATARGNATHVGTVELIRALSEAVLILEDDNAMPQSPLDALLLTDLVLERLGTVYKVIDDNWFHQEALSEEEIYRRFVQQQQ